MLNTTEAIEQYKHNYYSNWIATLRRDLDEILGTKNHTDEKFLATAQNLAQNRRFWREIHRKQLGSQT